jgi:hypothetical protein
MTVVLDHVATQDAFAAMVGITQPRVAALLAEGILPRGGTLAAWLLAYTERLREQAREALDAEAGDKITATHTLAGWIEGQHDELSPAGELDGPFADLLNHALGCVDWYEIAQSVMDDEYADWCEDNPQEETAE